MIQDEISSLSTLEKRALLTRMLQKKAGQSDSRLPLSYNQQSLLTLYKRDPGSTGYNTEFVIEARVPLNVAALRRALDAIVERHSVLRTTYRVDGQGAFQIVEPNPGCGFQQEDVSEWEDADIEARINDVANETFDLEHGSVLRARLLTRSADDHLLALAVHHIAFDYWSSGVFVHELNVLYNDFRRNAPSSLPPLEAQYSDFVSWQGALLAREQKTDELWTYWRDRLRGELPVLNLPTDSHGAASELCGGKNYRFALRGHLLRRLESIARRSGSTLYSVALAAFVVMLHRYAGQEDIIVGCPSAGRSSRKFEDLVGYFVNPLALRFDCSGNPAFNDFLRGVGEAVLGGVEHCDFPFPLLVDRLAVPRDPNRSPIFDVMFSWDKPHERWQDQENATFTLADARQLGGSQDLTFVVFERPTELTVLVQYNAARFAPETVKRMAGHYSTLLESIVENSSAPIHDLAMLTGRERDQLLREWNDTAKSYPSTACIHQVFEEQVAQSPDAVAVVTATGNVTYRDLNLRANRLAHYLRRVGVGPGSMVGVYLDRSDELIVAVLAILKAGGAYVPFDPSYPRERLAFMLEDTSARVVLTESALAERLPSFRGDLVCLDDVEPLIQVESADSSSCAVSPDALAYVMYTSGSTGLPKGVCVPHRGVIRLVKNANYMSFAAHEVFLQFAPISFDASTLEIWGSLLNGARLVVFPAGTPSLSEYGAFIERQGITTLWMTAGFFHLMVDHGLDAFRGVKQLLAGGDVLSPQHVAKAKSALPDCQLINGYGPTENTTFTCCYTIPTDVTRDRSIPIGRPIANTNVYVLDEHRRLVPIGAPGELYTGGDGLALGYLNRADLTGTQFVPDPFDNRPNQRLYRTGDLVRYLPDGNIEFLGRVDSQVKIRGFRIEPGEIEASLKRHEGVKDAVVIIKTVSESDKRIVAYVVPKNGHELDAAEIRAFLSALLPSFMNPSAIVVLSAFPLSPNGKIDRRALPDRADTPVEQDGFATPARPMETLIANIWREVLRVDKIGIQDNFFDLGGNSLLIMQVHARLEEVVERQIPIVELFKHATVASLAAALTNRTERRDQRAEHVEQQARRRIAMQSSRLQANKRRRFTNV